MSDLRNPDLIIGADGLARPLWAANDPLLQNYYDTEWGVPIRDERGLFERLSLEAFQSGLSWATILRKREAFRQAFCNFNPDAVAVFTEDDVTRLLSNDEIIRNRKKIEATIINAQATVKLRNQGGLAEFIWSFQPTPSQPHTDQSHTDQPRAVYTRLAEIPTTTPESHALAKALKKEGFTFVGPTTMNALMEAIGMVNHHLIGSHRA